MSIMSNATDGSSNNAAVRTVDNASGQLHRAIDKATDAARPAVDQVAGGAHHAVEKVASAANHAVASVQATGTQIRNAQVHAFDAARNQLRDRPLTTLGIAVAAGFLLNWAMRR